MIKSTSVDKPKADWYNTYERFQSVEGIMNNNYKKMATIIDVAKRSGVSVGTVSNVLNGTAKVSFVTRQKVNEAIEALNFRPNDMARSLRFTKSRLIGLLAP